MIVKSKISWWKSWFYLVQSLITLITFDRVYLGRKLSFGKTNKWYCSHNFNYLFPKAIIEIVTFGRWTII